MPVHAAKSPAEVLVAIVKNPVDFEIARSQLWYRVPVASAPKRWPPQWLAFYQTKAFAEEAYSIRHYARVRSIKTVTRNELFPNEKQNFKSERIYHQLLLEPLEQLPAPIFSRRWRRIVFIPTTWRKFTTAVEINDLYDESPLEDRLWAELKRRQISAEGQYYVQVNERRYNLDFAVFCRDGKVDIEADGDTWHAIPRRIADDNQRNNDVTAAGWSVLRFNTKQIHHDLAGCLSSILKTVDRLQGLKKVSAVRSRTPAIVDKKIKQLEIFEEGFTEIPEEIYTVTENAANSRLSPALSARVKNNPRGARLRVGDAQVELFKELPKPSRRKKRGRKK